MAVTYVLPEINDDLGNGNFYEARFELLNVLNPDAGPCEHCDKHVARLSVREHVNHNGTEYTMSLNKYAHTDGSEAHERTKHMQPKSHCSKCDVWGTIKHVQEAYGDRVTCTNCGDEHWYSIGD